MRQRKHSKLSLLWENFLILLLTKFIDSSLLFKTFTKCSVFDYGSVETCREVILVGTLPSYIYNNILNLSINAIFAMFESYNFWWLKILNLRTCFHFFNLRRLERYRIVFDEMVRSHPKSPLGWMSSLWGGGGGGWMCGQGVSSHSNSAKTKLGKKVLTLTVHMVHSMKTPQLHEQTLKCDHNVD